MAIERLSTLRTPGMAAQPATEGAPGLEAGMSVNATTELVVDLLAATGLVPPTSWRSCGRAASGTIAQAMVEEGVASGEGIARTLAVRHQVPLVDLALAGSTRRRRKRCRCTCSSGWLPSRTRSTTAPWHRDRRPRQHPRDRRAAARDAPSDRCRRGVPRRRSRRDQAHGARCRGVRRPRGPRGGGVRSRRRARGGGRRPRAEDGISDAPLVRLVNSVIFQAAEDGASDVHFEPQEDARRPLPRGRCAAGGPPHPEADDTGRDDAAEGAPRSSTSPSAASR